MTNSPARSGIDVGSVIAGTYTIEALIGRGGMGAVFLASHNRLPGKKIAIKVLHSELGSDEILARFKREAHIAASLDKHPNIVRIDDYSVTADGMPYLVLEYLQGESLSQRLRRVGALTVDAAFPIIRQIGSGLAAAHAKGIVHRDLKPQNIFLVANELDTGEVAKILDFGISKLRDSQTVKTQDTALLGTPQYMAPEQATGQHDKVDERTDIFALGAIVYEMLAGAPAFSGQTIPEVVFKVVYEPIIPLETRNPTLSEQVTQAVGKALAKKPEERFPSVTAFLEALTGSPVSLMRHPMSRPPPVDGSSPTTASVRTPNTGNEAFERTMASGERAVPSTTSRSAAPTTDHRAPSGENVPIDATTVQSYNGRTPRPDNDVGPDALASTVASSERPAPETTAAGSKRTVYVAAGIIAVAVAAAAVAYFALREPPRPPASASVDQGSAEHPAPPPQVPQVEKDIMQATARVDAGTAQVTPDAAIVADNTGSGSGKPDKPDKPDKPGKKPIGDRTLGLDGKPTPDPDDVDAADDSRAGEKLRQAFAAYGKGKFQLAGELATAVETTPPEELRRGQLLQAKMLLGMVACRTNNLSDGQAQIRALAGHPKMQNRVRAACKQGDKD